MRRLRACMGGLMGAALIAPAAPDLAADSLCQSRSFQAQSYTVCRVPSSSAQRLVWSDGGAEPYYSFDDLKADLAARGQTLRMAMNAGMYHPDRRPVGLYIENGNRLTSLQTRASYGNFGLLPNGVFFIKGGQPQVMESRAFKAANIKPDYASQSGPMLVIDGALHPKFIKGSDSRKRRNGIGVSADGQMTYWVISEEPVNFYSFASLFKDDLKTPNALYFDGVVSRLYDPAAGRNDPGMPMGPMIAIVESDKN